MFAKTGDEVMLAALQLYHVAGGSPVSLSGPSLVSEGCFRVCEGGRRNHVGSVAPITRCSGKSCIPKRAFFVYIGIGSVSATTRGEATGREAEKRRGRDAERQRRRKVEMWRGREAERQKGREAERRRGREAERQSGGEAERQRGREAERQSGGEAERQRGREAERQRGTQAGRQTLFCGARCRGGFVPTGDRCNAYGIAPVANLANQWQTVANPVANPVANLPYRSLCVPTWQIENISSFFSCYTRKLQNLHRCSLPLGLPLVCHWKNTHFLDTPAEHVRCRIRESLAEGQTLFC